MMLTRFSSLKYGLVAILTTATLVGLTTNSHAETLVGLTTSNSVFTFNSATPNNISAANNKALVGFAGTSETAVSIDYRPLLDSPLTVLTVGQMSVDDTTIVGRLYNLDPLTGFLTNDRILSGGNVSFSTGVLYTIDFNPTGAAPLRIIGSDNSNYRVTDVDLGITAADTALTGTAIPAVGVAYSNNDNNTSTGTQLYYVDRSDDRLATTAAPNGGVTTDLAGALGINLSAGGVHEIDISGSGVAYGVFQLQGENFSRLYTLNLANGESSLTIDTNRLRINNVLPLTVRGIAAAPVIVPENNTMALLAAGLTFGGVLVRRRKISK